MVSKQPEDSIDDKIDPDDVPDILELVKQQHVSIVCNIHFLQRFERYLQGSNK